MTARGGLLEGRGLAFRYSRGGDPVFADIDVVMPHSALTTITGASGTGKSTLLYVLSTLLRPTAGHVLWDGRIIDDRPDGARSRWRALRTGFVFQDAMLDPSRSVLDNVCEAALFAGIPLRDARVRAEALLTDFGVAHRTSHRPGEISGGQAQRVALCRALLTNPDVIFGDEPTGNLDLDSAAIVWEALQERARAGATVVVATHDMRLAATADHRIELS